MDENKRKVKPPVTQEVIFKIMMTITFGVSSVFFVKNLVGKNTQGMLIIGACLFVFTVIALLMNKLRTKQYTKQFILSICLVVLVFVISANSGNFYSDDFPLFLALIALSGLYLEPRYTQVQAVLITIVLLVLYYMHPEKADPFSQYMMCVVLLDVAAYIIYLVIKRGRAFIEISDVRAEEAKQLLGSMKNVGEELQENYINSSNRLQSLKSVNNRLEENTDELFKGSGHVRQSARELESTFGTAHEQIRTTGGKIDALNQDINHVETALDENNRKLKQMGEQIGLVSSTVHETAQVFAQLQNQVQEISALANQLGSIAFNTRILALNASVEAARAGHHGAGFAVVASEVQGLAAESDRCSKDVSQVVEGIKNQIEITSKQMSDSARMIASSQETMASMIKGFEDLMQQFEELYQNVSEQNENVRNVDSVFGELEFKVKDMDSSTASNQAAVETIVDAIHAYKQHMNMIVDDTKQIQKLSAAMIEAVNDSEQAAHL